MPLLAYTEHTSTMYKNIFVAYNLHWGIPFIN